MVATIFEDFDLKVTPRVEGGYKVQVEGPGGGASHDFHLPFTKQEHAALMDILTGPARDTEKRVSKARSKLADYKASVRIYGERLFDATFEGDSGLCFARSLDQANQAGAGLRLRLRLEEAGDAASLPWEYLYHRSSDNYLSLWDQTAMVRYLQLPTPPAALLVSPPLNILVVLSDPTDFERLAVQREWDNIKEAFEDLEKEELVSVSKLPSATLDNLQDALGDKEYHVLHFVGHGGFDPETGDPAVVFEGPKGRGRLVQKDELRVALSHFSLRLVVLNSCEGGRADDSDPFSGLAQSLVQKGIPAAIGMQYRITDGAALTFARRFYRAVTSNQPIDAALASARRAIYLERNPTEWGTPVLYMHAPDGLIFQVDRPTEEEQRQRQIEALSLDAHAAIDNRDYQTAVKKLTAIQNLQQEGGHE